MAEELFARVTNSGHLRMAFAVVRANDEVRTKFHAPWKITGGMKAERIR
jgi:hypothetical protein